MNKKTFSDRAYRIIVLAMIFLEFILMVVNSNRTGLWYDELFNVAVVREGVSIKDFFHLYLHKETTNLPFYPLILYYWCKIFPFKEEFMLLISEIATCIGIFTLGEIQKKLFGKVCAICTVIFAVTSERLLIEVAWEVRAYAFLFMFVALFLYSEIALNQYNIKNNIIRILVIAGLAYSHYFGVIFILVWAALKLIGCLLEKRKDYKWIAVYAGGGALLLPWMIGIMICNERNLKEFWPEVPDLYSVFKAANYLTSGDHLIQLFLLFAVLLILFKAVKGFKNSVLSSEIGFLLRCVFASGIVVFADFIYSKFIIPDASLWVLRYFLVLLPCIFILAGYGLYMCLNKRTILLFMAMIYIYEGACIYKTATTCKSKETFREASELIKTTEDGEITMVCLGLTEYVIIGFERMYFNESSIIMADFDYVSDQLPESLWICWIRGKLSESQLEFLEENYVIDLKDETTKVTRYLLKE